MNWKVLEGSAQKVYRAEKRAGAFDTPERKVLSMATISENKKNGKNVFHRFIVCLGRDAQKKQMRRFMAWIPLGYFLAT